MTGTKQIVFSYGGVIPKSGKAVIEFGGHKLVHRSIKQDKSDLLVHVDSKIIIRSYPQGTDRSIVLDDLANNIEKLEHFISYPELYLIQERPDMSKSKDNVIEKSYECNMTHYSDGSRVVPRMKQEFMLPIKKSYNVKEAVW